MVCPICNKRKAKRLCPARAETICTICCGTEREVTIECPHDCEYLMASREYDAERQQPDASNLPFADTRIDQGFVRDHEALLMALDYALCKFAASHREVVDADVQSALHNLAESYRTLASGLYYEKPLDHALQRAISEDLKAAIAEFRKEDAGRTGMTTLRDSDVRDTLIFLTQFAAVRANGRPKGRAFLDALRQQFAAEAFASPASSLLVLP